MPSCLDSGAGNGHAASDVKAGHCYIDRYCYNHGDMKTTRSGYRTVTSKCEMCDASKSTSVWSAGPGYVFTGASDAPTCHLTTLAENCTSAGWLPPKTECAAA